jgi:acetaldehyde dehydrogenase (acetylating)
MSGVSRLRVAIIGTGNIGTDLLFKVRRSDFLKCSYFVGRRDDSPGVRIARESGVQAITNGIDGLLPFLKNIDLVFDATSAQDHKHHSKILLENKVKVINLTPAKIGQFYVPNSNSLNASSSAGDIHLNMITCGGQSSIPFLIALSRQTKVFSAEIVSTISSSSAGPATRRNLDEYIENTENAITEFTGITLVKCMLVLNPAIPEIPMHTSFYVKAKEMKIEDFSTTIQKTVLELRKYIPFIEVISPPTLLEGDLFHFAITIKGAGDYLPEYSGNLDVINLAAIAAAEEISKLRDKIND